MRKLLLFLMPVLIAPTFAAADAGGDKRAKAAAKAKDHELARQAVLRGEVMSLPRILTLVPGYQAGEVIEVELETKSRQLIYDVHVLTTDGVVRELRLDAHTGKLIMNRIKAN